MNALILTICLLGESAGGYNYEVYDRVDIIELNHLHSKDWEHIMDQIIYWEWVHNEGEYRVVDWRKKKTENYRPHEDFNTGLFVAVFEDNQIIRRIESVSFMETETNYDPEVLDRDHLPTSKRRLLKKGKVPSGLGGGLQNR